MTPWSLLAKTPFGLTLWDLRAALTFSARSSPFMPRADLMLENLVLRRTPADRVLAKHGLIRSEPRGGQHDVGVVPRLPEATLDLPASSTLP